MNPRGPAAQTPAPAPRRRAPQGPAQERPQDQPPERQRQRQPAAPDSVSASRQRATSGTNRPLTVEELDDLAVQGEHEENRRRLATAHLPPDPALLRAQLQGLARDEERDAQGGFEPVVGYDSARDPQYLREQAQLDEEQLSGLGPRYANTSYGDDPNVGYGVPDDDGNGDDTSYDRGYDDRQGAQPRYANDGYGYPPQQQQAYQEPAYQELDDAYPAPPLPPRYTGNDDGYDGSRRNGYDDGSDNYAPAPPANWERDARPAPPRGEIIATTTDPRDPMAGMPPIPEAQPQRITDWLYLADTTNERGQHPYRRFAGWAIRCRLGLTLDFMEALEAIQDASEVAREQSRRTGKRVMPKIHAAKLKTLARQGCVVWNFPDPSGYGIMAQPPEGVGLLDAEPGPQGEPSMLAAVFDTMVQALRPKTTRPRR